MGTDFESSCTLDFWPIRKELESSMYNNLIYSTWVISQASSARWLDIGQGLLLHVYGLGVKSRSIKKAKETTRPP